MPLFACSVWLLVRWCIRRNHICWQQHIVLRCDSVSNRGAKAVMSTTFSE
jgi:hypothetical protein